MRRSLRFLSAVVALGAMLVPARAELDVSPADGLPDIWAIVNGVGSISPSADDDGDGQTNAAEAIAGTNPNNPVSAVKIKTFSRSGANVTLVFPAIGGKKYEVQSSADLTGGFAALVPASIHQPATDSDVLVTVPAGSANFFRVVVSNLDSDGDGLTNYEERMVGLNPNLADSNSDGTSDFSYVSGQLALPDTVSVRAVQSFASEDGPAAGTFEITRARSLFSVTIPYSVSGTATPATDYLALSGSVSLGQGETSVTFSVMPNTEAPNVIESGESVTVTLLPPPPDLANAYAVGTPGSATVIIGETVAPNGTGLLGQYWDTASTTYANAANFGTGGGTYTYFISGANTGLVQITYTGTPAVPFTVGSKVNVVFGTGNLANGAFNKEWTITESIGSAITMTISGTSMPTSGTGNAIIAPFTPPVLTRLDPTVDFNWLYGTPAGLVIPPNNSPDNLSAIWEGYLSPTTAGSYQIQLNADDKARIFLDTDGSGPGGLVQILENGWDTAATGAYKMSAAYALAVPATPAARYRMRVEFVETTGNATCQVQWRAGAANFANIPQANVFLHREAGTYNYTQTNATTGSAVITYTGAAAIAVGNQVDLGFSSGNLISFSGVYTVTAATATTFTVPITGASVPASGTGSVFVPNSTVTTTGWAGRYYPNTTFTGATLVRTDTTINSGNDGLWGTGTPDPVLINPDTFSVRWTGQVQPQYSELYTFVVNCEDAAKLWINGQPMTLKVASATNSGGTYSYDGASGECVVSHPNIPNGSFAVGETARIEPTTGNLNYAGGSAYTFDGATGLAVVDYSNVTTVAADGFTVGETVFLDPTTGSLAALGSLPYVITAATSTTFTVNFGTGAFTSGMGVLNIADVRDAVITAVGPGTITVSFGTGKSATGTGSCNIDWLNKPIDWTAASNIAGDRYARVSLEGGVRYDIRLDYFENTLNARCQLSWYSASQPKQIIPSNRLYPSSTPSAPPILTSETTALALVGGPFSLPVAGSNGGNVTVSGNPAWLTYSNGVLSGTPPPGAAGTYQVVVTTTGPAGTGTSVINIEVQATDGTIAREFWNGVTGTTVASIPTGTAPSGTENLSQLAGPTDSGEDYGARIRGYITAPATGNYYFWIAASNAAELWVSNDDEPVNALKRAWVSTGNPAPQTWNGEANQKSPWLALEAGQRYYVEILHKAGVGAGDNLAVGWLKAGQIGTAPSEVVPGYVLSPYVAPAPGSTPGTLYVATMLSQSGAVTNGVGTSTLRLSEDETTATMRYTESGLTGPITQQHIHVDPYLTKPSAIVFDIDTPVTPGDGLQPDGSYKWTILDVSPYSAAEIREIIKQGKAYINLHTALYPAGEIRGNYTLANGSRTFTPPPPPPSWTDDHTNNNAAGRFLTQATFGPNAADIAALKAMASYEAWIDDQFDQFTKPASYTLPEVLRTENASAQGAAFASTLAFNAWWRSSLSGSDQLRQRVAFALSEIHVVSAAGPLDNLAHALAYFYDHLVDDAFGNFRDILENTTLTPTMGRYLDMLRNDKPDMATGRIPNENYAREIKQLFSVGLFDMWPDGSLKLNSNDELVPTYTQREIVGFAHVFTGWDYGYDGAYRTTLGAGANWQRQMREVPARHYVGPKRILNNEVLPGLTSAGGLPVDPDATHSATQYSDPTYQALAAHELDAAHDQLFNHPNVGPFICRQLIQRMVTSHPSRDYLYRVVQKFNDNGAGVRGDMKAVIKAILLDYEARSRTEMSKAAFGKQREPLMTVAGPARALRPNVFSGTWSQTTTPTITVTSTSGPHLLVTGNNVFLDFTTGAPPPFVGSYSASVTNSTVFTVQAPEWATGTYNRASGSATVTITIGSHWLLAGFQCYLDFTSGNLNGVVGTDARVYTVATSSGETSSTFTITLPSAPAGTSSGSVIMPMFRPGSYTASVSGLPAPNDRRVTLDTNSPHNLSVGDQVQLNFTTAPQLPLPLDRVATVESIVDLNTYTVLTTAGVNDGISRNQGYNGVYQFPLRSMPLSRNGLVSSRPSTFNLGSTETEIDQSPINSPTVFNFFLPDYKYPGTLASQGITTPEFQNTAETTVIRQANFLYDGIFNPTNNTVLSSFRAGTNAVVMDLSPWTANAVTTAGTVGAILGGGSNTAHPWTHDANLSLLIDRMSTLLMGGQLPGAVKASIIAYVQTRLNNGLPYNQTTNPYTNIPYDNTTATSASASQKRDRLRAILHFIITSPDFTIQR